MPIDAHTHTQIHAALGALTSRLEAFGDVSAVLKDVEVTVTGRQPGRGETVTCAPWAGDGGRLWFFDSWRKPIIEADNIVDAAVLVAGKVRGGQ